MNPLELLPQAQAGPEARREYVNAFNRLDLAGRIDMARTLRHAGLPPEAMAALLTDLITRAQPDVIHELFQLLPQTTEPARLRLVTLALGRPEPELLRKVLRAVREFKLHAAIPAIFDAWAAQQDQAGFFLDALRELPPAVTAPEAARRIELFIRRNELAAGLALIAKSPTPSLYLTLFRSHLDHPLPAVRAAAVRGLAAGRPWNLLVLLLMRLRREDSIIICEEICAILLLHPGWISALTLFLIAAAPSTPEKKRLALRHAFAQHPELIVRDLCRLFLRPGRPPAMRALAMQELSLSGAPDARRHIHAALQDRSCPMELRLALLETLSLHPGTDSFDLAFAIMNGAGDDIVLSSTAAMAACRLLTDERSATVRTFLAAGDERFNLERQSFLRFIERRFIAGKLSPDPALVGTISLCALDVGSNLSYLAMNCLQHVPIPDPAPFFALFSMELPPQQLETLLRLAGRLIPAHPTAFRNWLVNHDSDGMYRLALEAIVAYRPPPEQAARLAVQLISFYQVKSFMPDTQTRLRQAIAHLLVPLRARQAFADLAHDSALDPDWLINAASLLERDNAQLVLPPLVEMPDHVALPRAHAYLSALGLFPEADASRRLFAFALRHNLQDAARHGIYHKTGGAHVHA